MPGKSRACLCLAPESARMPTGATSLFHPAPAAPSLRIFALLRKNLGRVQRQRLLFRCIDRRQAGPITARRARYIQPDATFCDGNVGNAEIRSDFGGRRRPDRLMEFFPRKFGKLPGIACCHGQQSLQELMVRQPLSIRCHDWTVIRFTKRCGTKLFFVR